MSRMGKGRPEANRGARSEASSRSENEVEYNLEGKVFRSVSNTGNGEVDAETVFRYRQTADIVTADYSGGSIVAGHLIARRLAGGRLDMRYHHLNDKGDFMLGKCLSTGTFAGRTLAFQGRVAMAVRRSVIGILGD